MEWFSVPPLIIWRFTKEKQLINNWVKEKQAMQTTQPNISLNLKSERKIR